MTAAMGLTTPSAVVPSAPKRIIVCCDGTWMDSLGKKSSLEPPSNVTRISRVICRNCCDGTPQIINYFPGVGTAGALDQFTGGAFGMGLDRDIREVYNFICTNYVEGDSIILVGFSRGAFTARSTADMIASLGLLTPEGLDHFYTIFDDYENMGDPSRNKDDYLVPGLAAYNKAHGQAKIEWENARMLKYKQGLKDATDSFARNQLGYTRDTFRDGVTEIRIKALAVWDTVGTLGIPPAPVIGVRGSADQWRFTNTQVSDRVENAFQALALDEPRFAFRPALWERLPGSATNLKQVWFPGTHANVGGGWFDQHAANITLAWMCDQLSSVGVEFNFARMTAMFRDGLRFSAAHPFPYAPPSSRRSSMLIPKMLRRTPSGPLPWAGADAVFSHPNAPPKRDAAECDGRDAHPDAPPAKLWQYARPWGLGMLRSPTSTLMLAAGRTVRRPGLALRVDEDTNEDTAEPLLNTAESIHASVRVRLACAGLGPDDRDTWPCDSLLRADDGAPLWRLERAPPRPPAAPVPRPREVDLPSREYPADALYPVTADDVGAWRWVYARPVAHGVPQATVLPEEPLVGYWERYLLALLAGEPDSWAYARRGLPSV
ncbi:hypothetical protein B0T26DRAFT_840152 [Lasiosphaeria miniovina]|uniref:T6SS Phospholipase effector Tle1-like catalytic domain-containing protein n=1 Tax=Lasiosphaeria miniovina TaxID=1954250 RepID=A0AA39ZUW5_9PEZI|nr:uncharacterized protein B0T26DRAFT_840152 [Lasiosphaeria miniovina]KAK0704006.1 hypothetical protein B0T26DRAFT_840152 [Lasiosphaeria miniovina]